MFYAYADPDPNFNPVADPDLNPEPSFQIKSQIDLDPDPVPDPSYHSDADPDPDFYLMRIHITKVMRIRIHNTAWKWSNPLLTCW